MPSTVSLTPLFDLGASELCSMLIKGDRAGQAHGGHVESLADVVRHSEGPPGDVGRLGPLSRS
jgi:hypothetical protein